jgi:probable O-glycosylation ligase (exosortase A-associated)
MPIRDIILAAITVVVSFFSLQNPTFGLLSYVGYAVVNPQSYTWDFAHEFPHSRVIAVVTVIAYVFSRQKTLPRQRELFLLLAFWLLCVLSSLFAVEQERAWPQFSLVSKILFMACLTACIINSEEKLHLLLKVIAIGLGLYALKAAIFVVRTGGVAPIEGPPDSFLEANNTIGMALAVNVPLLFYLAKNESRRWLKWVLWAMMAASYPAVAGTFARASWIGLAFITVLLGIKTKHKVLTLVAAGAIAMLAMIWVPQIVSNEMASRYETLENPEEDVSAQTRFWSWEFCRRVGVANPLGGAGFNFYSEKAYVRYYWQFLEKWPGKVWSCHNMWLTIFAEHGAIAFVVWTSMFVLAIFSLRQMAAYGRAQKLSWVVDYSNMLQIALAGFMLIGMFIDIAYYEISYQLIAVVIVMKEVVRQKIVQNVATGPVPSAAAAPVPTYR